MLNSLKVSSCFLVFTLLFSLISEAQDSQTPVVPKRIYTTKYVTSEQAPRIDGLIDDAAWNEVEWATDFIENEPDENTPPTFQTKFKILYDSKNLYVAIQCFDKACLLYTSDAADD